MGKKVEQGKGSGVQGSVKWGQDSLQGDGGAH